MKRIVFIIIISILPLILFSQDYSVASEYVFNNRNEENIKLLKHTFYNPEHKKLLTEFIEYKKKMNDFLSKSKVESNNINSDIPKLENPEQSYIHRQIQKDETELADLNKDIPYYEINVKTAKTSLEFVRRNNTNDRSAVNEYNNRVDIYNKAISKRKNLVSNLKLNKAQYNKLVEEWNENVSLKKSNSTNTSNSILTESKQLTDSKKGLVEKVSNRIALAQLFFKDGYANYIGNFDSTTTQNGITKIYYLTGELKESGTLKNGEKDGLWKVYFSSGNIKEEYTCLNGNKVGVWKKFAPSGKLIWAQTFN